LPLTQAKTRLAKGIPSDESKASSSICKSDSPNSSAFGKYYRRATSPVNAKGLLLQNEFEEQKEETDRRMRLNENAKQKAQLDIRHT
jgi:hypothetical protein